ncbi:hypothetical protein GQ44DRAFT_774362 [Phaeosphaeriaceae sp. PMI808]|nr:hypothetical protein GQ44DRAFT_774362 [Phaeosphaeriaceae sp. PMI808]
MDNEQLCDEESRQHIYALLEKYEWYEVCRLVQDIALPRSASTSSFARSSLFSHISTESRLSPVSTDYPPSQPSSTSSRSRRRRGLILYRSGLNPTKPSPLPLSSPCSQTFSPTSTSCHDSPFPIDCDSNSVTSTATGRSGHKHKEGIWFCTFCTDLKTYNAKSDWKKHEIRHHETGEKWPCPFRNCFEIFDREVDFQKHCVHYHPDSPVPKDVKIRLLPKLVYGCGFDGCKAVLTGWDERCNHVADLHMKKEGLRQFNWKYTNVIRNLLRQDATRNAWKELFAALESKEPRHQITWNPVNTRVLKQKLECCDMRPDVDEVVHTALAFREGRPFNDTVELHPDFRTPSQDSIHNYANLSAAQRNRILKGLRLQPMSTSTPKLVDDSCAFMAHPGNLVEFTTPTHAKDLATQPYGRRSSSIMDIDEDDLFFEPDPQIPPGLELGPERSNIEASHQCRSSRGHIIPKSLRHFTSRLSPK